MTVGLPKNEYEQMKARSDLFDEVVGALDQALTDYCAEIGGGRGCPMKLEDIKDELCKNCPYYQSNDTLTKAHALSPASGQGDSVGLAQDAEKVRKSLADNKMPPEFYTTEIGADSTPDEEADDDIHSDD